MSSRLGVLCGVAALLLVGILGLLVDRVDSDDPRDVASPGSPPPPVQELPAEGGQEPRAFPGGRLSATTAERSSLLPSAFYSVRVVAPSGHPVGSAEVIVSTPGPVGCKELRLVVNGDGYGRIEAASITALVRSSGAREMPHTLTVSAAKWPWAPTRDEFSLGVEAWQLVLRRGSSLVLRLLDESGRPVPELPRVALPNGSGRLVPLQVTQSQSEDAEPGVFTVEGVPIGDQILWVSSAQHALQPIRVLCAEGVKAQSRVLRPSRPLNVRVTGRGRGWLVGARVEVRSYPPTGLMAEPSVPVLVAEGVTDSTGVCRLPELDAGGGINTMTVVANGWTTQVLDGLTSGQERGNLLVELTPAALVRLEYTTASHTPLNGLVRVRVAEGAREQAGAPLGVVATAPVLDGRAVLDQLPVGWPLRVEFRASSNTSSAVWDRFEISPLTTGREVEFSRFLDLHPVEVWAVADQAPGSTFSVAFLPNSTDQTPPHNRASSTCTVAGGSVARCFVPAGDYRVLGQLGLRKAAVSWSITGPTTILLEDWGGSVLRGRLVDSTREVPHAGRRLLFRSSSGRETLRGITGREGSFELKGWDGRRGKLLMDIGGIGELELSRVGEDGDLGEIVVVESTLLVHCADSVQGSSVQAALDITRASVGPPFRKPARLARHATDENGELRLLLPIGTYRVQPIVDGRWGLATEVSLSAGRESLLEVPTNEFAEVTWHRPEGARGAGTLIATSEEFSLTVDLPAVPRAGLILPVGTVHLRFEGTDGGRWVGALQVNAP